MASFDETVRLLRINAGRIQLSAMKRMEGEMKLRIFANSEATEGGTLGTYRSKGHKRKRVKRGRQIARKDLVLDGDLQRSIITGQQDGKAVIGFSTNRQRIIAQGQEQQIGKEVFSLSDREIDLGFQTIDAEVKAILRAR